MLTWYNFKQIFGRLAAGGLFVLAFSLVGTSNVMAAPVSGFVAGRIIDDAVFTNNTSMSPAQIQSFLNSKVPVCDTWGTQPSEFGGGTRAQWGAARGYNPPYICLKDYAENGKSSSQIIYDISQQYRINPQVLIVLLQKEQALVTDTWPTSTQYRSATGYGCPDTAPCDSQYYGLTNQLSWAARMFRSILDANPGWYTPYILGNNYIRWSPNSACGGGTVNIENRSTQALYNYTPYQPNQSALNAGYGMGDSCGAYGNRNFYLYFTDWFGSVRSNDTTNPHPSGTLVSIDGRIYIIKGSTLHHLANATIFESWNYRWEDVKPATAGDKQLTVSWPVDFHNPALLYRSPSSGVYTTVNENGKWVKKHMSQYTFNKLGYRWNQVRVIPEYDLPQETSTTVNFSEQHPNGALITTPQGVQVIDNGTRRYISPWVFESHRWSWNDLVPQTAQDAQLPQGSNMLFRDGSVIANAGNIYIVELPGSGPEIKRPIGPWNCYANIFRYNTREVIILDSNNTPPASGPLISC